jgi:predicted Rossmann fold nucleotide-binding protein DprA/Smf involved in DNA uptake
MRRPRRRPHNPAQLSLFGDEMRASLRSRALNAVNASLTWQSAEQIAKKTGMTYRQTIDALNALHNEARVARHGRKFTARWGSLSLVKPDPAIAAAHRLEDFFRATRSN